MTQENLLERLKEIRKNDNLRNVELQKELIQKLFPKTTENLIRLIKCYKCILWSTFRQCW